MELDGNMALHTHNDIHLSIYHNTKFEQNETKRSLDKKAHLRVHHPNAIFSFGYQNQNPFNSFIPPVLSTWMLGGIQKDCGTILFGGLQAGFCLEKKALGFTGLLLGLKHSKFTGFLDYNLTRCKKTEETTDGEKKDIVTNSHNLKVFFDSKCCPDTLVFGEATTDLASLQSVVVGAEYNLGNNTNIKAKVKIKG